MVKTASSSAVVIPKCGVVFPHPELLDDEPVFHELAHRVPGSNSGSAGAVGYAVVVGTAFC